MRWIFFVGARILARLRARERPGAFRDWRRWVVRREAYWWVLLSVP